MKNNFTNEQVKELVEIAKSEEAGKVVNLSYFGSAAKVDTRLNRIERILPDVANFVELGKDNKFYPLNEQKKADFEIRIFNNFWKNHLDFVGGHFEFNNLQDDFFTTETYNRLLSYSLTYFTNRIDAETAARNQFKFKLSTKNEVKMLEHMNKTFPKSLYRKMKEVSKNFLKRKKEQGKENNVSMLQGLIANNLAWQDATLNADGTKRALEFELN